MCKRRRRREVIRFKDLESATAALRILVAKECNSIGIYDYLTINKLIRDRQTLYRIRDNFTFDDVGNRIYTEDDRYIVYRLYNE